MDKLNYSSFKEKANKLRTRDVIVEIDTMIKTKIEIENLHIITKDYTLELCNEKNKRIEIDINYVANFYEDGDKLILELDSIGKITINKK